jgi:hypothetical protein
VRPSLRRPAVRAAAPLVALALLAAACSGGDDDDGADDDAVSTTAPRSPTAAPTTIDATDAPAATEPTVPPTTAAATTVAPTVAPSTSAPAPPGLDIADVVGTLASDEMTGRDDGTDGWVLAQTYLAEQLSAFAQPSVPGAESVARYLASAGSSVNVIGVIPGTELADEFVVLGAHYDGLGDGGDGCRVLDPSDTICNGAADNATGVATVLAVAHELAESPPRRSVLIAFWDREEDGLIGSADFLATPVVPVDQMVAYLNFDIQGANLSPALRETTVMVGAETGGATLVDAAHRATEASTLTTVALSLIFGQGRSDHANFVNAGVPSVFFTDANNGCYHTTRDDIAAVDFGKLDQQIATAVSLAADLADADSVPAFVPDNPVATYQDAVSMLAVTKVGQADFSLLTPPDQAALDQYVADLQAMVDDGEAAFDDADIGPLLSGAANLVSALATTECDGYVALG